MSGPGTSTDGVAYDRRMAASTSGQDPQSSPTEVLPGSSASIAPHVRPRGETRPLPDDHPGVTALFGVLLAGEIAAFYRLTAEAAMAPDLRGRVAMAQMAGAEMVHFEILAEELGRRGHDIGDTVEHYAPVLDRYHGSTTPNTWLESMVKAYIGDGLAADFYLEVAHTLPHDAEAIVQKVMAETGHSEFAREQVRAAVAADPDLTSPLRLWGRRLLGEAITQAQHVLASEEALTDVLFSEAADLGRVSAFFESIQDRHAARMRDLDLG
ncbi:tRNA-(MS[2]IO[6]A)-hydroxylase (MiaE)-like [Williamsia serinedens]|uniref:tRNA-(MS[2]IO[6]A)-hydroxylase (MiaE)-like n=2 Tax=Williamsia serinedens TaxID=391736 RepID=A0ABT1H224_9NOCA|nr:tRNA-(MS[2]IO[6]A)-hydroxylase (MiaE)-like [Williamsia serinedens]